MMARCALALTLLLSGAQLARANPLQSAPGVTLAPLLSDHAVLQRDHPIKINGTAAPGAAITVRLAEEQVRVRADRQGGWSAVFASRPASAAPISLQVTGPGDSRAVASDLVIGDVWLCAGQSNMEMQVSRALDSYNQAQVADDPLLRVMTISKRAAGSVEAALPAGQAWAAMNTATVGNVSAVCYYMLKTLRHDSTVPVGAIVSAWGGTQIKSWLGPAGSRAQFGPQPSIQPTEPQPGDRGSAPGLIFNAMIAPIGNFGLRGAVWYQGESDVGVPGYRQRLAAMTADWRTVLGQPDLPFLIVQLANFGSFATGPGVSSWAELREEQRQFALSDGRTMLVSAIDLGERSDIHPANKRGLGERLALAAGSVPAVGPFAHSVQGPVPSRPNRNGPTIRLPFTAVQGALRSWSGTAVLGVELCAAANTQCRYAGAQAKGSELSIADDGRPVAVIRYAWADSPVVNLYDDSLLPVAPFEIALTP